MEHTTIDNLKELEQELFTRLESRERLIKELKKGDKEIERLKGLIIHRMVANKVAKTRLFELISVNLEKPILLNDIRNVLPNERLVWEGIVVKVDYQNTLTMLNSIGIKGLQAQNTIKQIKSLQSDYYKDLILRGK